MAKQAKYRNIPVVVEGIRFHSKGEARRWQALRLLEKAGAICDLERQKRFALHVKTVKIGAYVADFVYLQRGDIEHTVEDFKGMTTPLYRWKKKHFEAEYGLPIVESH